MRNIYLDNSATSRHKPFKAYKTFFQLTWHSANSGRSSHTDSITQALAIEDCRTLIREKIKDGDVVFTKNCTEALNIAIFGSELSGEVLTTVYEHNSILRPLSKLEKENQISIKYIYPTKDGQYTASRFERAITEKTKAIVITEMSNVNGEILPIEDIAKVARAKGIRLIVDTAQSLGHLKTNYKNVDILASSGHKGLNGFQGSGLLIVEKGIKLNPLIYGGTGTFGSSLEQPKDIPDGFESGTQSGALIGALKDGITFVYANLEKINNKIKYLGEYVFDELSKLPNVILYTKAASAKSGIISFNIKGKDRNEIANCLNQEYHISVRSGMMCAPKIMEYISAPSGLVRCSIGYNNSINECKQFVKAVINLST